MPMIYLILRSSPPSFSCARQFCHRSRLKQSEFFPPRPQHNIIRISFPLWILLFILLCLFLQKMVSQSFKFQFKRRENEFAKFLGRLELPEQSKVHIKESFYKVKFYKILHFKNVYLSAPHTQITPYNLHPCQI